MRELCVFFRFSCFTRFLEIGVGDFCENIRGFFFEERFGGLRLRVLEFYGF